MAASRAAYFLAIVIPVNIAVVCWITGLRPRSFLPWLPSPLLSAAAGILVVYLLSLTGLLDELPAFAALVVAGTASCLATGGVLFALEPRARSLVRPVLRKLRRRTGTATA